MKKILFKLFLAMLFILTISFTIVFNNNTNIIADEVDTEETVEPTLNIYKKNISYSSYIYIVYSVSYEGIDTSVYPVKMLFFDNIQDEYTTTTATSVVETSGSKNIDGVDCLLFYSKGIAAKEMTDDIYARAYVEINDEIIYSEVVKYSVLEYYYEIKEAGTATTNLQNLLDAMINYGAAAQINFNYNMDRLANATYYKVSVENAVLPDGFTSGRFKAEGQVTLTALEKEGYVFTGWTNSNGDLVSTEITYTLTVAKDETLTANYEEEVAVTPVTLTLTKEAAYDATTSTLDLPTTVTFDYNNETVTENVTWDTTSFVVNKIGKQKLYGTLSNDSYKVNELSIEIDVLPYTFSLDEETNEYTIIKYYGTAEEETIPSKLNGVPIVIIGERAFSRCGSLKSIEIPLGITSIGIDAFESCWKLTSIILPDSLTSIGNSAFNWNNGLTNVYYNGGIDDWCDIIFDNYSSTPMNYADHFYLKDSNGEYYEVTEIEIPNTIAKIGNYQFFGFENITSIIISEGVTSIGSSSFSNCSCLTSIVIPTSVTSLGDGVFYYCKSLTSVKIPDSVTSIGNGAFSNCSSLTSIEIPTSVTSIGAETFGYCSSLTSIELPNSITSIGPRAFCSCTSLKSIKIPDGVTSIEYSAFAYCSSLTSIEISSSVTSIGESAFDYCISLTDVFYEGSIKDWINLNLGGGYNNPMVWGEHFYMKDSNSQYYEVTEITIPDEITKIDTQFCSFENIRRIIIPDSVTNIHYSAFKDCDSLIEIIISENNNNYKSIDGNVYSKDGKTFIKYAPGKEETLFSIPDGVTNIQYGAFAFCKNYTKIVVPSSVTSIGQNTFYMFIGLTSIEIPEGLTSIGNSAFYGCSNLTSMEIPSTITSIGSSAFRDCSSLESITIPSSVTSIGDHAFSGCSNLTSIEIPSNVTSIGNYAFYNCSSITSIEIPSNVTSIGNDAFYNCSSITSIEIPLNVTSIGNNAFYNCSSLTSIEIPSSVTSIGNNAFDECSELINVYYRGTIKNWCDISFGDGYSSPMHNGGHFFMENASNEFEEVREIIIPNTLTKINNCSFNGFIHITRIVIPSSVTSIEIGSFSSCSSITSITLPFIGNNSNSIENSHLGYIFGALSWSENYNYVPVSLKEVTINSEINIGNYAFFRCSSLTSITFSNSVISIGEGAFNICSNLVSIEIPSGVTSISDYAFSGCSSLTSIELPSSLTSIGNDAFSGCGSLTSIEMPEGVTSIGECAFRGCSSLTSIIIPDSVTSIGEGAFSGCSCLTSITLPFVEFSLTETEYTNLGLIFGETKFSLKKVIITSAKSIGSGAFSRFSNLISIEIPSSVTSIGDFVFEDCSSLINIEIPSSVMSIGKGTFYGCSSLEYIQVDETNENYVSIDGNLYSKDGKSLISYAIGKSESLFKVPNSVYSIEDYAFCDCSSLTSIEIPKGVTSIGDSAFAYCSSLTSITIPDSVINIGDFAFEGCSSLEYIEVDENNENYLSIDGNLYSKDGKILINYAIGKSASLFTIPNHVVSIGNGAFWGCRSLTSIEIPEGVTSIGYFSFSHCSSLERIKIPEGVTSIEYQAFCNCSNLKSIEIPSTLKSINMSAFFLCNSLTTVYNLSNLDLTIGSTNYGYVAYYAKYIHTELPREILLEKEVAYDVAVDSLYLPETVTFSYNEEEITLDVIWDTTTFVESQVGEQIIYGVFNDDELYDKYNINREGIYIVIKVL